MLKKIFKVILIVVVFAFIVAQFVRPEFSNPPIVESETLWASTDVPADVRQVITRSCADCHSNETRYPWYSQITPSNWFLANHVAEGRHEVNFSTWASYKTETKKHKLEEVCEQVEQRWMPLPSYLWIHREAVMSDSDVKLVCDWTKAEIGRLEGTPH